MRRPFSSHFGLNAVQRPHFLSTLGVEYYNDPALSTLPEPTSRQRGNRYARIPLEDEVLIARAKDGDGDAFSEVLRRYEEAAFRAAYLVLHDADDARDATQEGFLRAYQAIGRFRPGSAFRPWLLRIVMNQALSMAKSKARRTAATERLASVTASAPPRIEDEVADREQALALRACIEALREQERVIIYLRFFLLLSEREMAEYLGCAQGTVKSRLHRALGRLGDVIRKHYPRLLEELP